MLGPLVKIGNNVTYQPLMLEQDIFTEFTEATTVKQRYGISRHTPKPYNVYYLT